MQKDIPPIQVFEGFDSKCSNLSDVRMEHLKSGNINDTWLIFCGRDVLHSDEADFVLQKINSRVFTEPRNIAKQIQGVSEYIERQQAGFVARIVPGTTGLPWVEDAAGEIWKMACYVRNTCVSDKIGSAQQAKSIAAGFGRFQYLLCEFELPIGAPPIDAFHQLSPYLDNFHYLALSSERALSANSMIRQISHLVQHWLPSVSADLMCAENKAVIHGDCKVSNILLSTDKGHVSAVVDLDTVMYGARGWDFGDLVRSGANALTEKADTAAYSQDYFEAIASGFIPALHDVLKQNEKEQLVISCQYMTFMLAVRFLVDYLDGDIYFQVSDSELNLRRAGVQLELLSKCARRKLRCCVMCVLYKQGRVNISAQSGFISSPAPDLQ